MLNRRSLRHTAVLLTAVLAAVLGVLLYLDERDTRQREYRVGALSTKDRLHIDASVQKVDPGAGELTLRVRTARCAAEGAAG